MECVHCADKLIHSALATTLLRIKNECTGRGHRKEGRGESGHHRPFAVNCIRVNSEWYGVVRQFGCSHFATVSNAYGIHSVRKLPKIYSWHPNRQAKCVCARYVGMPCPISIVHKHNISS